MRKWTARYEVRHKAMADDGLECWLAAAKRTGAAERMDPLAWVDLLALATSERSGSGRPITHWTQRGSLYGSVSLVQEHGRWFASVSESVTDLPPVLADGPPEVGIDLGVRTPGQSTSKRERKQAFSHG